MFTQIPNLSYTHRLPRCSMVIFFSCVTVFVNSRHFLAELQIFLPLNEKDWVLDTRTSALFTLAPVCCMFSMERDVLSSAWTDSSPPSWLKRGPFFLGLSCTRRFPDTEDDCAGLWLIDWVLVFTPSDLKRIFETFFEVWWLVFLTRRDVTGHYSTSCLAGWRVYQAS